MLISLFSLSRQELVEQLKTLGFPAFRAKQVWHWAYNKGVREFSAMTTIAKADQQKLAEHFSLARPTIARNLTAFDETRKWLLEFTDGNKVETVFIPESDRGALCVSSQVG